MTRLSKLMVTTGILSIVGLGLGASPVQAQAPSRAMYAPQYVVVPGTPGLRVRPSVISPSGGFPGTAYASDARVSRPQSTWYAATRDYSTGRENLPISKPWLRPLP